MKRKTKEGKKEGKGYKNGCPKEGKVEVKKREQRRRKVRQGGGKERKIRC